MSEARMFRPSRRANITLLLCWVSILSVDIYFTVTHLHTMGLTKKIVAGLLLFTALISIKTVVNALRAKVQP
jgi:hypothetical protein